MTTYILAPEQAATKSSTFVPHQHIRPKVLRLASGRVDAYPPARHLVLFGEPEDVAT